MYLPILLLSLICVQVLPISSEKLADVPFEQTVNRTQLARDTVQFCYFPNGHPYICKYYVFASTFKDTWFRAREYCISLSEIAGFPMHAVAIESKEENELIKNHILTYYSTQNWWTSGHDSNTPHLYIWFATGYGFTYYDWYAGQPADTDGSRGGVVLMNVNGVLQWHDDVRANTHYVLCEQNF